MNLGISSHSFGWAAGADNVETQNKMTVFDVLDFAFERGIKLVQIADNMPLHLMSDDNLRRLKDSAKDKDIEIELGLKGTTQDSLHRYIELCGFFGCSLLRIVTDARGYEPPMEKIISWLIEVKPVIEAKNIRIAIENHDRFKCEKLAYIIQRVDSKNIGICLDTANSIIASEGVDYVHQVLKDYVINVHIKDYKIKRLPYLMGFTVDGCPAGDGDVDIPKILRNIKDDVNVIVEIWTTPEDTLEKTIIKEKEWVEKSIEYLRDHIDVAAELNRTYSR